MGRGDADTIERVLQHRVWAVVGLTDNPSRAAYGVARFLRQRGKQVVPVNPTAQPVHGLTAYRSVGEIPFPVDVVDVFRRSEAAGAHIDEAISAGAKAVWLQLGVIDDDAADRAAAAGLDVVMDHCPAIEWAAHGPS